MKNPKKRVCLIVAHPDDETLWAGGAVLRHPSWQWSVVCLCRASDKNRAPKFFKVLKSLHAKGAMGDLDDGPEQTPLAENLVENTLLNLLPTKHFDLVYTHNPTGEYTSHLRHQEVSRAVIELWHSGQLITKELRTFAYEDGDKAYYPKAVESASIFDILAPQVWKQKFRILTKIYGFPSNGWEALTTPKNEAFWKFSNAAQAMRWLENGGKP